MWLWLFAWFTAVWAGRNAVWVGRNSEKRSHVHSHIFTLAVGSDGTVDHSERPPKLEEFKNKPPEFEMLSQQAEEVHKVVEGQVLRLKEVFKQQVKETPGGKGAETVRVYETLCVVERFQADGMKKIASGIGDMVKHSHDVIEAVRKFRSDLGDRRDTVLLSVKESQEKIQSNLTDMETRVARYQVGDLEGVIGKIDRVLDIKKNSEDLERDLVSVDLGEAFDEVAKVLVGYKKFLQARMSKLHHKYLAQPPRPVRMTLKEILTLVMPDTSRADVQWVEDHGVRTAKKQIDDLMEQMNANQEEIDAAVNKSIEEKMSSAEVGNLLQKQALCAQTLGQARALLEEINKFIVELQMFAKTATQYYKETLMARTLVLARGNKDAKNHAELVQKLLSRQYAYEKEGVGLIWQLYEQVQAQAELSSREMQIGCPEGGFLTNPYMVNSTGREGLADGILHKSRELLDWLNGEINIGMMIEDFESASQFRKEMEGEMNLDSQLISKAPSEFREVSSGVLEDGEGLLPPTQTLPLQVDSSRPAGSSDLGDFPGTFPVSSKLRKESSGDFEDGKSLPPVGHSASNSPRRTDSSELEDFPGTSTSQVPSNIRKSSSDVFGDGESLLPLGHSASLPSNAPRRTDSSELGDFPGTSQVPSNARRASSGVFEDGKDFPQVRTSASLPTNRSRKQVGTAQLTSPVGSHTGPPRLDSSSAPLGASSPLATDGAQASGPSWQEIVKQARQRIERETGERAILGKKELTEWEANQLHPWKRGEAVEVKLFNHSQNKEIWFCGVIEDIKEKRENVINRGLKHEVAAGTLVVYNRGLSGAKGDDRIYVQPADIKNVRKPVAHVAKAQAPKLLIREGTQVRIVNLQAAQDLNGKVGTVVSLENFASNGRVIVKLDDNVRKSLKMDNLQLLNPSANPKLGELKSEPCDLRKNEDECKLVQYESTGRAPRWCMWVPQVLTGSVVNKRTGERNAQHQNFLQSHCEAVRFPKDPSDTMIFAS